MKIGIFWNTALSKKCYNRLQWTQKEYRAGGDIERNVENPKTFMCYNKIEMDKIMIGRLLRHGSFTDRVTQMATRKHKWTGPAERPEDSRLTWAD